MHKWLNLLLHKIVAVNYSITLLMSNHGANINQLILIPMLS